jgi:hypothetical protein
MMFSQYHPDALGYACLSVSLSTDKTTGRGRGKADKECVKDSDQRCQLPPLYTQSTVAGGHPMADANQSLGSAAYEIRIRLHIRCQLQLSWPI